MRRRSLALAGLCAALFWVPAPAAASGTCMGVAATIVGTPGPDELTGTPGPDVISSGGGDDVIHGWGGDDLICSAGGDDRILAGGGNDRTAPGGGDDVVDGGGGGDIVTFAGSPRGVEATTGGTATGQGDDELHHVEGFVGTRFGDVLSVGYPDYLHQGYVVHGGAGDDVIRDGSPLSASSLHGGPGDDTISTGGGRAGIHGGPGDDTIALSSREGFARGGPGDDDITIDGPWVSMTGGPGDDRLESHTCGFGAVGYADADGPVTVDLGAGTATGQGHDTLVGVDRVYGSPFADLLIAGRVHECLGYDDWGSSLGGGGGDDQLVGGNGSDSLSGGSGDDSLSGRMGDDDLWGDDGIDRADGGEGTDRCEAEEMAGCEEAGSSSS